MKRKIFILIAGLALIATSGFYLTSQYINQKDQEADTAQRVEAFMDSIKQTKPETSLQPNDDTTNEDTNDLKPTATPEIDPNTIGVLTIEALDRTFPVASQDSKNTDTINTLLKTHAVLYSDYGSIGLANNNAVIVAHSAINNLGCGHCYFDNIESLNNDDKITFIDQTGTVYIYEVVNVIDYLAPNDTSPYASKTDQNSWLTLITCTDGDSNYRTAVQAVLVDHYDL